MRARNKPRRIKRLAFVGLLIGGVITLRRAQAARRSRHVLGAPATWPPLVVGEEPVAALGDLLTPADAADPTGAPESTPASRTAPPTVSDEPVAAVGDLATDPWVAPVDGVCPVSHPVKANGGSGIYHLPGGPSYERTRPQRCYVDAAAAEADGYRAAKNS